MEISHRKRPACCKLTNHVRISRKHLMNAFYSRRAEAVHMWRDSSRSQQETHSAQAILDGFSYISDTISSVGAQPTKTLSSWVADKIVNPAYWRPNSEISCCKACRINFERNGLKIHHCKLLKLKTLANGIEHFCFR